MSAVDSLKSLVNATYREPYFIQASGAEVRRIVAETGRSPHYDEMTEDDARFWIDWLNNWLINPDLEMYKLMASLASL